jgi:hypothetical protein
MSKSRCARTVLTAAVLLLATSITLAVDCTHRTRFQRVRCDKPECICGGKNYEDCLATDKGWVRFNSPTILYDCETVGTINNNLFIQGITTCGSPQASPDPCVWLPGPLTCACGDNHEDWGSTTWAGGPYPTCVSSCDGPPTGSPQF